MSISNLINSIVKHADNKGQTVPQDIYNQRLTTCRKCHLYDAKKGKCKDCGCYLSIKASWASEKCPLNKWVEHKMTGVAQPKQPCCEK